jgi:hypothetical protein
MLHAEETLKTREWPGDEARVAVKTDDVFMNWLDLKYCFGVHIIILLIQL